MNARRLFAFAVAAIAMLFPGIASATHGPAAPGGPYAGYATGSVVHVDALTTDDLRVANLEVGVANAVVGSSGLEALASEHRRPIVPDEAAAAHSRAAGSVVEAGLLLGPPEAANQVAPFRAESISPGGTDVSTSLLNTAVGPVAFVDLAHRGAATRWNDDTCVIGEPIASGEQHLARAEVLETADDPETPATNGFDAAVAGLDAHRAGPPRASSSVRAVEQIYRGNAWGLQSVVATTLAPVTFLEGTPNEFTVEVDGPAFLSATADGTSGGADVTFGVPLVTVIQSGVASEVLPGEPFEIRIPQAGDAIAEVRIGVADPLPAPKGLGDALAAGNGTRAAAQAHVVEVKLLDLVSQDLRGATVALGHMEAAVTVPSGGITCPLPVTKVASPSAVRVGASFDTTITVHNPFACPLTNVRLTDRIGVEKRSLFTITRTAPAASAAVAGQGVSRGSARWQLGSIAAGGHKPVVVTLRADGGAGRIVDEATAVATLTSCPAKPARSAADVTGLARVNVPASGTGRTGVSSSVVLGRELVPTGVADVASILGGVALLALALVAGASMRRRV